MPPVPSVLLHPLEPAELDLLRAAIATQAARLNLCCPLGGCGSLDCRRHLAELEDTLDAAEAATRGNGTCPVRLLPGPARALVTAIGALYEDVALAAMQGYDTSALAERTAGLRDRLTQLADQAALQAA